MGQALNGSDVRSAGGGVPLIEELLARMTLVEKAGQMSQLPIFQAETTAQTIDAVREGRVGSFLNAQSVEQRNGLQRVAVEESRLKIPLIFGRDVIHGYKTVFPIPLGQSATFDPALVERAAAAAAAEAHEAGIDWVFAPMVDIARDPRWGRIAESCGEDPYLAARMGAAMVRGFQGPQPGTPGRVAACAKHFAGYGAAEAGREYGTTCIPEQLLREVYLAPFKACVDAGVLTLMTGFNDLNGVPATGNDLLLENILRGEWGFAGFVVSDWGSIVEMVRHGFVEDEPHSAVVAAQAGVDMEMGSGAYANLPKLVDQGRVALRTIDEAVRRVLTVKHRLGLFDRPYAEPRKVSVTLSNEHRSVARELARESIVLLKNEGRILPLGPHVKSIAVIGPQADDPRDQLGCWSFDGEAAASLTVLAALRERCGRDIQIHHAKGVEDCRTHDRSGFGAAIEAAKKADVVLAFVGEPANLSGECRSRAFLDLPGVQQELLECLAEVGRPIVVTVLAGRPLTIGRTCELAQAALYAWHPGTMGGPAIVDLLTGDVAPSGKLPVSFPRAVGQIPIYYNAKNTGRPATSHARGIPIGTPLDPEGFESSYIDVDVTPEFPFGFGLSYSSFEYFDLRVTPSRGKIGSSATIAFQMKNAGDVPGVDVAQLYVRDRVATVTRPVRELKRFERVSLARGETKTIEFAITTQDLGFWGRDMRFTVEPGVFDIFVGGDSRAGLGATFEIE
ncbi:MAG TPA: beta-glucosidase BglX [Polyangiaceae bacterium]|nr:beta-glucosidase BglX [Polyangiaceae bacterium]